MIGSGPAGTRAAPWEFAAPWGARGYVTQFDGPVHWIEFGQDGSEPARQEPARQEPAQQEPARQEPAQQKPAQQNPGGAPIVFVHGLGGSHLNWCLIGPRLAAGRRAVALDLHGFGLTRGTRANATVQANQRLLDRFVREITGTPVILAGNSMGGLISLLQTTAAPDTVQGLVLIDPALPLPVQAPDWAVTGQFLLQALPGLGELYTRKIQSQPPQLAVQRLIELCFADPSRAEPTMITASIALASQRQGPGRPGGALPRGFAFFAAGDWPPEALLGDDGRGASPGPAHRRRRRSAGSGGGHPRCWCTPAALGYRRPGRGRAHAPA